MRPNPFFPLFAGGKRKAEGILSVMNRAFPNSDLFATLPLAIALNAVGLGSEDYKFEDPEREKLSELAANAGTFDRMTVGPVNESLDRRGVPLTPGASAAIQADIKYTRGLPEQRTAEHFNQQADNQDKIAVQFLMSDEPEGWAMHKVMAGGFRLRAGLSERIQMLKQKMQSFAGPSS